MNKLNTDLKNQAIALGMCAQWQGDWKKDWNVDVMAERFFKGINFCVKHHFPDKDFLTHNFDKNILRSKNIIVDDNYSLLNPTQALITGCSESTVRYNGLASGKIHIQGDANVKLSAKDRAHVIVHIWDDAQIEIKTEGIADVSVARHSANTLVISDNKIRIKNIF